MCNQVRHYQQNDKKTVINCTRSTVSVQYNTYNSISTVRILILCSSYCTGVLHVQEQVLWSSHPTLLCKMLVIMALILWESANSLFPSHATIFTLSTLAISCASRNSTSFNMKVHTLSQKRYVFSLPACEKVPSVVLVPACSSFLEIHYCDLHHYLVFPSWKCPWKLLLGKLCCRWKDNTKTDPTEIGCEYSKEKDTVPWTWAWTWLL